MGKYDNLDKEFFGRKEHLAELIEHGIYRGRLAVSGMQLQLLKNEYPSFSSSSGEMKRDILTFSGEHGIKYAFEIENNADYGMPRRIMVYDAGEYEREASEIRTKHDRERDYANYTERKSGIRKGEKYKPVVTAVLYLGTGHYTGGTTLKECLDIPKDILPYVDGKIQNYSFPLIEADYVNPEEYHTELRQFFKAMQCRNKDEKLDQLFKSGELENLSMLTKKVIALHLNIKELETKVIEEGTEMCKAYRDLVKTWKKEGREECRLADIRSLMKNVKVTAIEAMEMLGISGKEQEKYLELL